MHDHDLTSLHKQGKTWELRRKPQVDKLKTDWVNCPGGTKSKSKFTCLWSTHTIMWLCGLQVYTYTWTSLGANVEYFLNLVYGTTKAQNKINS